MSKRSLFWGNGSGKLGEAVFYRAGGEQRTRTYIKTVKNPKSYQQALQRTKLNNLVGCYKGMSTAVKSFFNNRASNQSPFNAFFRLNFPLSLWVADKEMTGVSEGIFEGLYVSNGTFNFDTTLTPRNSDLADTDFYLSLEIPESSCEIPINIPQESVRVGKQMYQLLVGDTNPSGLPSEFFFTVILIQQGFAANGAQVFTMRCAADSEEHFRFVQGSPRLEVPGQLFMDNLVTFMDGEATPSSASAAGSWTGVTRLGIGTKALAEDDINIGAAVVISFKDSAGKQCTKSSIFYGAALTEIARDYLPTSSAGQSIVSHYQTVSTLIE